MTDDLEELRKKQERFIATRDWEQFHTPKSLAMAISVEANELVEIFQWHDNLPSEAYEDHDEIQNRVEDELADIVIYTLSMASQFDIELPSAVEDKLDKNTRRFDKETAHNISEDLEQWKDTG